jgi:hypothetical protein
MAGYPSHSLDRDKFRRFVDGPSRARGDDLGFRAESDGGYRDVIEIARSYHGPPLGRITDAIRSQFGTRPYRYRPPTDLPRRRGDWSPAQSL